MLTAFKKALYLGTLSIAVAFNLPILVCTSEYPQEMIRRNNLVIVLQALLVLTLPQLLLAAEWRCQLANEQPNPVGIPAGVEVCFPGSANADCYGVATGYGTDGLFYAWREDSFYDCGLLALDNCPVEGKMEVVCCAEDGAADSSYFCDETDNAFCEAGDMPDAVCGASEWYCGPSPTSTYERDWRVWSNEACTDTEACPFANGRRQITCAASKYNPLEFYNTYGYKRTVSEFLDSFVSSAHCDQDLRPNSTCSPGSPYLVGYEVDGVNSNKVLLKVTNNVHPQKVYPVNSGGSADHSAKSLPPGLYLDEWTGQLKGTPTADGTWHVQITATNVDGASVTYITIVVDPQTDWTLIITVVVLLLCLCVLSGVAAMRYKRHLEKQLLKDDIKVREGFTEAAVNVPQRRISRGGHGDLEDLNLDELLTHNIDVGVEPTTEVDSDGLVNETHEYLEGLEGLTGRKGKKKRKHASMVNENNDVEFYGEIKGITTHDKVPKRKRPGHNGEQNLDELDHKDAVSLSQEGEEDENGDKASALIVTPSAFALPPDHPRAGVGVRTNDGDPNVLLDRKKLQRQADTSYNPMAPQQKHVNVHTDSKHTAVVTIHAILEPGSPSLQDSDKENTSSTSLSTTTSAYKEMIGNTSRTPPLASTQQSSTGLAPLSKRPRGLKTLPPLKKKSPSGGLAPLTLRGRGGGGGLPPLQASLQQPRSLLNMEQQPKVTRSVSNTQQTGVQSVGNAPVAAAELSLDF